MVIGLYIKNNPGKTLIDFDKFLQLRMHAKYLGDNNRRFIKEIKTGEDAYLLFHDIVFTKKK
jgi:hypothetical protein